jgi:hypothetical protein
MEEPEMLAFDSAPAEGDEMIGEGAGEIQGEIVTVGPEVGQAAAESEEAVGDEELEPGVVKRQVLDGCGGLVDFR